MGQAMGKQRTNHTDLVKPVVCLALAGALVLACGGTAHKGGADGGDSGGDTTSSGTSGGTATIPSSIESLDDLLQATTAIACRNECPQRTTIEFYYREDCVEAYALVYETLGASIQQSIDAGRTSLDLAEAQRCIDALADQGCGDEPDSACDQVFVGRVPAGGACTESTECADGGYCNDTLACPGVCEAGLSAGTPCADASGVCQSGLTCLPEGVCGTYRAIGEPCESSSECDTYYCEDADGDGESRCAEAPNYFVKALGEPCEDALDCAKDLYCPEGDAAPTCVAAAELGEPCIATELSRSCVDAAYCALEADGVRGVCVARVPLGGACADFGECAIGVCDGGTCEKHSGLGGPCVTDERCFGVCDGGVCAAEPACPVE